MNSWYAKFRLNVVNAPKLYNSIPIRRNTFFSLLNVSKSFAPSIPYLTKLSVKLDKLYEQIPIATAVPYNFKNSSTLCC